jgi:hypothetical protein
MRPHFGFEKRFLARRIEGFDRVSKDVAERTDHREYSMKVAKMFDYRDERKTRAQRFIESSDSTCTDAGHTIVAESVDLSGLKSKLNQASQKTKKTPVTTQHLTVLADVVLTKLQEILKKVENPRISR